jgi:endonuclease G, mitochondrial
MTPANLERPMKPADFLARKHEAMKAAGYRWRQRLPEVAATARKLAEGGPAAATNRTRTASFVARETLKRDARFLGLGEERIIGGSVELDDVAPTLAARKAGRPVARIVELLGANRVGEGFATGFMVTPDLLLTNCHVFSKSSEAVGCGAQFGFERNDAGLLDAGVVFELDPTAFFHSDATLDIALVGVTRTPALGVGPLAGYGWVRLIPAQGKILVGHPISVIQHPDGRHKHWGVRQNKLVLDPSAADLFISYTTDTMPGSSGSPAFNYDWELVAVHHSGVPRMRNGDILTVDDRVWKPGMPDSDIDWIANEGARVSKIHEHLAALNMPNASQQAIVARLLAQSTDPVVGGESALTPHAGPAAVTDQGRSVMNIVVNGTANFYGGGDSGRPQMVQPPPIVVSTLPAPQVGIEKKLRFDPDYGHRPGYVSTFLDGFDVPRPKAPLGEVVQDGGAEKVLDYHHYSLAMHNERRLVMWAAANADYDENKRFRAREDFGTDTWKPDPRILIENQIEDVEFYAPAKKFDRGHIIRRDDLAWGEDMEEEEFANSDSFHWTNCTPQHEEFNRDMFGYKGIWGGLENHIARQAGFLKNRLILFAGPVLKSNDPKRDFGSGVKVQVPMMFWKVLVAVETSGAAGRLRAYAFLLDQTRAIEEFGWENRFRVGRFHEQQVPLSEITAKSRVTFAAVLHAADPLGSDPNESRPRSLRTLEDVRLG